MKINDMEEEFKLKENYLIANFRLWAHQQASVLDMETQEALNIITIYLNNNR